MAPGIMSVLFSSASASASVRALGESQAQRDLDSVCQSSKWDSKDLEHLSLSGLQPCFEDSLLLLPTYIGFLVFCCLRVSKCWNKKSDHREAPYFMWRQSFKIFMALVNMASSAVLLSVVEDHADYELVVYPMGIVAWAAVLATLYVETWRGFAYHGQWMLKLLFMWVFIASCVRLQSQRALGDDVDEIYWIMFLVQWLTQMSLVVFMLLVEKPLSREQIVGTRMRWGESMAPVRGGGGGTSAEDGSKGVEMNQVVLRDGGAQEAFLGGGSDDEEQQGVAAPGTSPSKRRLTTPEPAGGEGQPTTSGDLEPEDVNIPPFSNSSDPEGRANCFSRLLFTWLSPIVAYGYRHDLVAEDIWSLRQQFRARFVGVTFQEAWDRELQRAREYREQRAAAGGTVPESEDMEEERGKGQPALLNALWDAFGGHFSLAGPMLLVQNVAQLSLPFLLSRLLVFIDNDEAPLWHGIVLSFGFFVGLMIMTVTENLYFDMVIKTGVKLRAGIVTAIYSHSLNMTNSTRQARSIGAITNYMATDTEKLQMQTMTLHNLWSSPIRIILGLILLVSELGWSGVIGFALVLFFVPLQTRVMDVAAKYFGEVMGKADKRIKLLNEVLAGMRVIKYYAWGDPFETEIGQRRADELRSLRSMSVVRAVQLFLFNLNPVVLAVGTFGAYAVLEGNLTPQQAFTALALFQQLLWPLMLLPRSVAEVIQARVSLHRIEDFLLTETVQDAAKAAGGETAFARQTDAPPGIKIDNASFKWSAKGKALLTDVNVEIAEGELVAVVGPTGSGKSSLLSAMLGEMTIATGQVQLNGTVAYVPQQAWIYNATVRDNILFGLNFNDARYEDSISVSSLITDIEHQFAGGDQEEIGEKGINLSGGQRQRISIARAVYANADVYLFDDPLSALDAHVGAHVFHSCIHDYLAGKTRVLVTNQLHFMPNVDRILVLNEQGKIAESGSFNELMADERGLFHSLYHEHQASDEDMDNNDDDDKSKKDAQQQQQLKKGKKEKEAKAARDQRKRAKSLAGAGEEKKEGDATDKPKNKADGEGKDDEHAGQLTVKETMEHGSVKWDVYKGYAQSVGAFTFILMISMFILTNVFNVLSSMWLAFWSQEGDKSGSEPVGFYIGIYVALSMAQLVTGFISNMGGFLGAVAASRQLHDSLVEHLMRAPMAFFDSTPLGRITNRLSKDINTIDTTIMFNLQLLLRGVFQLIGTLVVIGINTTYVLVPFVPIMAAFIGFQNYYRKTSVQLKRLDAVSRSPLYAHFTETLGGMSTVRAFLAQERMSTSNADKLDANQKVYILHMTSNRWLSIRLEFLGGLMILAAALNTVILRKSLTAAEVGVAMAYALQITTQLNMMVRFVTETENSFNSVERVQEYCSLKSEAARKTSKEIPKEWPAHGAIEMNDVVMSYREGLPPVLKGLSLTIHPGEKVGVVGRTGAGKSSLFQSLFRLAEITSGEILFDGVNTKTLGLDDVRRAVAIIPQEPVLFSGSLRFNLDPFEEYTEEQLWDALGKASLSDVLKARGDGLEMEVTENGENFSVGQRQLICLARALLRKTKYLVLDEATANVDVETDALIQKTIRENFSDRTTLTIAHRLNTVIDSDRVLVLDLGRVKEFDSPAVLLSRPDSEFSSMVDETGPQNAAYLRGVALGEIDPLAEEHEMAAKAQEGLKQQFGSSNVPMGELMRGFMAAAGVVRQGFDDRRAAPWVREREHVEVSLQAWLEVMLQQLNNINQSATRAVQEEEFDLSNNVQDIVGQQNLSDMALVATTTRSTQHQRRAPSTRSQDR